MSAQRFFVPAAAGATALGGYLYYNSQKPAKSRVEQRQERSQAKRDAGLAGAGVGQNAMTGGHEKGGPGSGVPTANMDSDRAVKTDAPREKLPSGGVGGGVGGGGANTRTTVDISAKKPTSGEGASASGFGSGSSSSGQNSSNKSTTDKDSSGSGRDTSNSSTGGTFGSGAGSSPDGQSSTNKNTTDSGNSGSGRGSAKSAPAGGSPDSNASSWSQGLQGIFGQGGGKVDDKDVQHRKYSDTKVHSNHADTPTKRFPGETVK